MSHRSKRPGSGIATRCNKRAKREAQTSGKETKRARRCDERKTPKMPQSVFPLLWSFLLESPSSDNIDPESFTACLDFKSIASFMLVSRGTKQAFDECNGWALCLQALKMDIHAKEELVQSYERQAEQLVTYGRLSNEELEQIESLLQDQDRMRAVAQRCVLLQNELLPKANLLAGKCACGGNHVPEPLHLEMVESCNNIFLFLFEGAVSSLQSAPTLEQNWRLIEATIGDHE